MWRKPAKALSANISNYSWLEGLSHPGMRERFLESFDEITIDCLNGDKFKTGKLTLDGQPDPSIFSTEVNREGIQVGTAIALLVRTPLSCQTSDRVSTGKKGDKKSRSSFSRALLRFRHFWGKQKRDELLVALKEVDDHAYLRLTPVSQLGLVLVPLSVSSGYTGWPNLPELFPFNSPGVKTSRDLDLVDIDRDSLEKRMRDYCDVKVPDSSVRAVAPQLMQKTKRFDPQSVRRFLHVSGFDSGHLLGFAYRPFDDRWLYWHAETKLLDERRGDLFQQLASDNIFLTSRSKGERLQEGSPFYVTRQTS